MGYRLVIMFFCVKIFLNFFLGMLDVKFFLLVKEVFYYFVRNFFLFDFFDKSDFFRSFDSVKLICV